MILFTFNQFVKLLFSILLFVVLDRKENRHLHAIPAV